jgi:hypothetical protein|uniref:Uncharacterized protein n=1 Tax=uncultured virus TaxID=340016 RepID=D5L2G0_9VIRU|nr:hypothetical protein [uncultured virus]
MSEKKEPNFKLYDHLYGSPVQMNDRFETVHIWSYELALQNQGRWVPKLIPKKVYDEEKQKPWNNSC